MVLVVPLLFIPICLNDALNQRFRRNRGGFFRALLSSARSGRDVWIEEACAIFRRWEFTNG